MRRYILASVVVIAAAWAAPLASASNVGQYVANQVDVASYQYYLDELLYTHDGHDRGWNGPHHDPARDNILATFQSFGLTAELHYFNYSGWSGENVVATQVGTLYPDEQYIIGAHYDSVGNPGADDNGSGVAAILEIARVLSAYETEYTVKYIAFDMEEIGLIGSHAYVNAHHNDDIRGMISLDMIAWDYGLYSVAMAAREESLPLVIAVQEAIYEYGNGLTVYYGGRRDRSDHAPFEQAGFQACWTGERAFQLNPCYHETCDSVDTPDYISYGYAADTVRSIAGFLADNAGALVPPCAGDLDGDGATNQADLGILLAAFGIDDGGDLNGDGVTDQADLGILLADWGCTL